MVIANWNTSMWKFCELWEFPTGTDPCGDFVRENGQQIGMQQTDNSVYNSTIHQQVQHSKVAGK